MSQTKNKFVVDAVEHLTARALPWHHEHAAVDAIRHLVARSLPDETAGTTRENTLMESPGKSEVTAATTGVLEPNRPVPSLPMDVVATLAAVRVVPAPSPDGDDSTR